MQAVVFRLTEAIDWSRKKYNDTYLRKIKRVLMQLFFQQMRWTVMIILYFENIRQESKKIKKQSLTKRI